MAHKEFKRKMPVSNKILIDDLDTVALNLVGIKHFLCIPYDDISSLEPIGSRHPSLQHNRLYLTCLIYKSVAFVFSHYK